MFFGFLYLKERERTDFLPCTHQQDLRIHQEDLDIERHQQSPNYALLASRVLLIRLFHLGIFHK